MTKSTTSLCVLVFLAAVGCTETTKPEKMADTPVVRIGAYDSRAIAVAFVGSQFFIQYMDDLNNRHTAAAAAGDKKLIAELKAEDAARQKHLEKQGFSTVPVDNILKYIADQIPKIKKEAGVDIIVSKWDTQALAKHKSSKQVDVTMLLVEAFKPSAGQKNFAIEIQKRDPVPLKKMEDDKH